MPLDILHTFTYFSSVLSVHIAIHRVGSGIDASVHWFALSDRHAVAHEYFGNNNLTYRQKKFILAIKKKNNSHS